LQALLAVADRMSIEVKKYDILAQPNIQSPISNREETELGNQMTAALSM
jgi:hypothetical protein